MVIARSWRWQHGTPRSRFIAMAGGRADGVLLVGERWDRPTDSVIHRYKLQNFVDIWQILENVTSFGMPSVFLGCQILPIGLGFLHEHNERFPP
jgi:hypothetical protein